MYLTYVCASSIPLFWSPRCRPRVPCIRTSRVSFRSQLQVVWRFALLHAHGAAATTVRRAREAARASRSARCISREALVSRGPAEPGSSSRTQLGPLLAASPASEQPRDRRNWGGPRERGTDRARRLLGSTGKGQQGQAPLGVPARMPLAAARSRTRRMKKGGRCAARR